MVYQVVRAPKEGGSVYVIAPVEDLGKVRHVHTAKEKKVGVTTLGNTLGVEHPVRGVAPQALEVSMEKDL